MYGYYNLPFLFPNVRTTVHTAELVINHIIIIIIISVCTIFTVGKGLKKVSYYDIYLILTGRQSVL